MMPDHCSMPTASPAPFAPPYLRGAQVRCATCTALHQGSTSLAPPPLAPHRASPQHTRMSALHALLPKLLMQLPFALSCASAAFAAILAATERLTTQLSPDGSGVRP